MDQPWLESGRNVNEESSVYHLNKVETKINEITKEDLLVAGDSYLKGRKDELLKLKDSIEPNDSYAAESAH